MYRITITTTNETIDFANLDAVQVWLDENAPQYGADAPDIIKVESLPTLVNLEWICQARVVEG